MTDASIPQTEPPETMYSKRYWLFQWYNYEASGGLNDFVESFDTVEDAIAYDIGYTWDRGHIFDSETRRLVTWVKPDGEWSHTTNE